MRKRQWYGLVGAVWRQEITANEKGNCFDGNLFDANHFQCHKAVSYTHLDVYKRQVGDVGVAIPAVFKAVAVFYFTVVVRVLGCF